MPSASPKPGNRSIWQVPKILRGPNEHEYKNKPQNIVDVFKVQNFLLASDKFPSEKTKLLNMQSMQRASSRKAHKEMSPVLWQFDFYCAIVRFPPVLQAGGMGKKPIWNVQEVASKWKLFVIVLDLP